MAGVLRRPGLSKAGMAVPGTPSIKLLVVKFAPVSNRAPPGARGAAPSTCSAPRRPRRAPSLDLRPSGGLAPRGREHGRLKPGGARLFPPRVPWLQGPGPLGCARRPPRGPGSVPPGSLGKPAHASNTSQAWAGLGGAPAPQVRRHPWPCPGPAALGPSSPRPGARPCPDGPALRTREGTRPLTRVALTHRPRFSSPPEPPPPALVATRHPGQVPSPEAPARALRDLAPGGLGGNPHAGHAPRGRASAPRRGERAGPSGQRAPRRLQRRGMRSARPFWGPFARWAVTLNQ